MTAIINFIKGIADAVTGAFEFLTSLIEDTLYVAQLAANAVASIPIYLSFMPPSVLLLIGALFTIVVVYLVLGRQ